MSPNARHLRENVKTDIPEILHQRALSHKLYLSLGKSDCDGRFVVIITTKPSLITEIWYKK